ncbi:uncharacterized protein LOC143855770 [Tasmannia lanceolata]|uniref:uncharacterized protein LOC143855770 n=1 Tax=Tasmannia lanceolata TaxID=3420 RepID=UPI0040643962
MEEVLDNPSTGVAPCVRLTPSLASSSSSSLSVDGSFPQITTVKLDGANYVTWKATVEKYLIARGKAHVIRRDPPPTTYPTFDRWEQDNALVCTLLWQSMAPHVSGPLMLLPTAKRIWDQVRFRRGDLPLATHYSHFVGLCQQLDVYMPLTTDLTEVACQRDQIRVVQYLESLGPEYMHLRQQIIGSGDIPSLTRDL